MQKFGAGDAAVDPEDPQGTPVSSIFSQGAVEETPAQAQEALDQENTEADAAPETAED